MATEIKTKAKNKDHSVLATKLNDELEYLVMGYIRSNIEENKRIRLTQIIPNGIKLLLAKFYGLGWIYSSIISFEEMNMLSSLLSTRLDINNRFYLKLLYRSSRDGCKSFYFHDLCDNKPNTVTIIQTKEFNHVIGGFTKIRWMKQNKSIKKDDIGDDDDGDGDTFLFLLRSNDNKIKKTLPRRFELKKSLKNPLLVQHGISLGPCFGFEDIHILSNMCDIHTYNNGSFDLFKGIDIDTNIHPLSGRNGTAGVHRFEAYKIEVFQLIIQDQ